MPRPNDNLPQLRPDTGKSRSGRIPLDYYKHADLLERWKNRLLVLGVLVPLGWWGIGLLRSDGGRLDYSRGPVAAVHAAWEARCEACHVAFTPISSEAWCKSGSVGHATDQKCTTCHLGPIHHASQTETPGCASCHHDHRGREASLVRVADADCTSCHDNLAAHLDPQKKVFSCNYRNVTRFDEDQGHHPPFEMSRGQPLEDPGHLKFNHQVHLTPGMCCEFTFDKIDKAYVKRYQRPGIRTDALVKLDCGSCHRLDSEDFEADRTQLRRVPADSVLPPRSGGQYMLPITYENQCAGCHPLTFEKMPDGKPASMPHRLQPPEMRRFLEGFYAAQMLKGATGLFDQPIKVRPIPGKLPEADTAPARKIIGEKVAEAERKLLSNNTCLECHERQEDRIVPPQIPTIWFEHAVFDHAAHRAVDCCSCHADARASIKASIPNKEKCVECHAPPGQSGGVLLGGARFDCVECHRYHNGDRPLQGLGAAKRGVSKKLEVQSSLGEDRQ
jgi:hypothetical protein